MSIFPQLRTSKGPSTQEPLVRRVHVNKDGQEDSPPQAVMPETNQGTDELASSPATPNIERRFDFPPELPELNELSTPQADRPAERGWRGIYNLPFRWLLNKTHWRLWRWLLLGPSLMERTIRAMVELKELTTENGLTATGVNSKGGAAKTTLMAFLSTLFGIVTSQAVGVVDMNPLEGNIHTRLGVNKTVAVIDLLWGKVTGLLNHASMVKLVGHHSNNDLGNVHVIRFSNEPRGTKFMEYGVEKLKPWLLFLRSLFHFMFIDQGNGYGSNWSLAAHETSDVILISVVPWQENSTDGAQGALEFLKRTYKGISQRCILVVSGHKGRITPQVVKNYAAQYGLPPERVVVIPYDKNFEPLPQKKGEASTEQPVRVIDPRKVRLQTLFAYLNCAILMAQTAQAHQRVMPAHPNQKEASS